MHSNKLQALNDMSDMSDKQPSVLLALGEPMIELYQDHGLQWLTSPGGDTSNVVVAAARQGAATRYLSHLGDDSFGRQLRQLWRDETVDDRYVSTKQHAATGIYFSRPSPSGGGRDYEYRRAYSAASQFTPQDLNMEAFDQVSWFHFSGITQAISTSMCDASLQACEMAKERGIRISYDTNYRPKLWDRHRALAHVAHACALSDLFLPSREDLQLLTGVENAADQLKWCQDQGASSVVLKDGARGAWVQLPGEDPVLVPALPVNAIDTSGAGDCFVGTLLARLMGHDDLLSAVRSANQMAALSVTRAGAVSSYPYQHEQLTHSE